MAVVGTRRIKRWPVFHLRVGLFQSKLNRETKMIYIRDTTRGGDAESVFEAFILGVRSLGKDKRPQWEHLNLM
jgi:hypothetical protein